MLSRRIFLSYAREDDALARQVAAELGPDRAWIDEAAIGPGDLHLEEVDRAVAEAKAFVLFWTEGARRSRWVQDEIARARIRAVRDEAFRILPVRVNRTEMPDWMAALAWIDGERSPADIAAAVLRAVGEAQAPLPGRAAPELRGAWLGELLEAYNLKVASQPAPAHDFLRLDAEEVQGIAPKRSVFFLWLNDSVSPPLGPLRKLTPDMAGRSCYLVSARPPDLREADQAGLVHTTRKDLEQRLVKVDAWLDRVLDGEEAARIEREYQPTELRMAGQGGKQQPAVSHMLRWIDGQQRWLTVLGDYGVGKTWMLKKLFFELARRYRTDHRLLPLFVPLQRFRKAIGFSNLVLDVLEQNGLHGVSFAAIDYLARQGRLVFLFDSFDEMASSLSQRVIQENLQTLLDGVRASKAILTSRPTYFERRAERVRVVERDRHLVWDVEDDAEHAAAVAAGERLGETFAAEGQARLLDLTPAQRRKLFDTVLRDQPEARAAVEHIDRAYTRIQGLSQKAVIARLLVSVARELGGRPADSKDGPPLLTSDEATRLNSAKLFDLIIRSLITRDLGVGSLNRAERRRFLRTLAVRLQQKGASPFVGPAEMRTLVRTLFEPTLRGVEDAEQEIESRYRVCRRHSGLTTEAQFGSSQDLDVPVEADDTDSNVGFSHNSLREYLVAEAIVEHLDKGVWIEGIENVQISDAVAGFLRELRTWHPRIEARLAEAFAEARQSTRRSFLFRLLVAMAGGAPTALARMLGDPPDLSHLVLANDDLSGLELRNGSFAQSILIDVDLSRSDLRAVDFGGAAIVGAVLNNARIEDADFRAATVESLYVFDRWGTRTRGVLQGRDARQWLYSNGARVAPTDDLNPLLGRPRYEVARAVVRHIRLQASFHERGLISGISQRNQEDAGEVVELLRREGVIERLHPSVREGWVMRVNTAERDAIQRFLDLGELSGGIDRALRGFLASELNREAAR